MKKQWLSDLIYTGSITFATLIGLCGLAYAGPRVTGLSPARFEVSARARYRNVTWPDQAVRTNVLRFKYPGRRKIGTTARWARFHGVVHVEQEARYRNVNYVRVTRWDENLGWVSTRALRTPREIMLPYVYTSQFWPSPASDACEAASLKIALSVKGKALHTPLATMVRRIPRSNSPYRGYTHNPWRLGTGASIYPGELSRVARTYGVKAHKIAPSHATAGQFRWYVTHGDPVVFEGSHGMRYSNSDHVLTLLGYKPGYFYYVDPESRSEANWASGWVPIKRFMRVFDRPVGGKRAMVVY